MAAVFGLSVLPLAAASQGNNQPTADDVRRTVDEVFERASVITEMDDGAKVFHLPTEADRTRLRHYRDSAIPDIARYLDSQDARLRLLSVSLLANQVVGRDSTVIIPYLRKALADRKPEVRLSAVSAVSVLPHETAIALWKQVATRDPDDGVRAGAQEHLDRSAE